ncbi:CHAT domain-containing protein [Actinoplanes sp. LDG1-06]|uniref:CHAT domain-containing protein n=1 Tax=Paractinoplanes ovalisporus TaxID=2810368 RepID=A0ABS2AUG6_9ACTN|nr:CHAT domain-containing protein [Actinoplanes ovalisporus]MBM2623502.1 CHAT domain-containing protein [Actinoplanes ovalisporus]
MNAGEALLAMALSRPVEALAEADRLIRSRPGAAPASYAHQARAIVLRDAGQFAEAIAAARRALRLAGDPERAVDVRATLGVALVMAGRTTAGLAELDAAAGASRGPVAGRVLMRRGFELHGLGRRAEALADLNRAIVLLHRAGDEIWEARARTARFLVHSAAGRAPRAVRDLDLAERIYAAAGQELELVTVVQNRAEVARQSGDLPGALARLDEAARRYAALGVHWPDLVFDRCDLLLAAGLADEALAEADAGIPLLPERSSDRAELLFAAARAAQAAGRPAEAAARARDAHDLFRLQGRPWWTARAAFVLAQARHDLDPADPRLPADACRIADRLGELRAEEAPAAHLLAGRIAAGAGQAAVAERYLAYTARFRRRGQPQGWLAQALRAGTQGRTTAALNAARRGLAAVAVLQSRLGAVELRAYAARPGAELAAIGQRHAIARGDPRNLLLWTEMRRASALSTVTSRSPVGREFSADLAALREVMNRLDTARATGGRAGPIEEERRRLEAAIRERARHLGGDGASPPPPTADEILDRLGDQVLVELAAVDGELHAVTARPGRIRLHRVGPLARAVREVEFARFQLRRLAHGRPPPGALDRLAEAGRLLQTALLGPAAADLGDGPVLIAPPSLLHGVPWGMLPALRRRPWSATPSAAALLDTRRRAPRGRRVVIVVGPGLSASAGEAGRIAAVHPDPLLLAAGGATAPKVLAALDGAATAHIAAHGVFRADNPLFSSLRLDDGPLTVHDLSRLHRAPYRLILSSCESGAATPLAGDELLGMISVLVPLGTRSLLAASVPVNDAASAPLMADFHGALSRGRSFAEALLHGRDRAAGDPVALATAFAFTTLGV